MVLNNLQEEFGMRVRNYQDNTVYIDMSSEDLSSIVSIVEQIDKIDPDNIAQVKPADHPDLTASRVDALKQQLLTSVQTTDGQAEVTLGLTDDALIDLSSILSATYSVDDDFVKNGSAIDLDDIERIEESFTAISFGLLPEEKIAAVERQQGISVPRYK